MRDEPPPQNPISSWWIAQTGNRQVVVFVFVAALLVSAVYFLGHHFTPAIVALIIAYVLDGPTSWLERLGLSRLWATTSVLTFNLVLLVVGLALLVPAVSGQIVNIGPNLVVALEGLRPVITDYMAGNAWLLGPDAADNLFTNTRGLLDQLLGQEGGLTAAVSQLNGVLSGAIDVIIYAILVPLMTFFFLKDRDLIVRSLVRYVPTESGLLEQVWRRTNVSISAYVRGKLLEIVLLGVSTYVVFSALGSQWSLTIAILTGVSPVIPIFGAVAAGLVTVLLTFAEYVASQDLGVPVGVAQGASLTVWFLVSCWIAYLVLQFIDGNLLQPLLFSEVVKLHPLAIFVAILIFGGLFGVWGLFFAIPAATLVRAILVSWPELEAAEEAREEAPTSAP